LLKLKLLVASIQSHAMQEESMGEVAVNSAIMRTLLMDTSIAVQRRALPVWKYRMYDKT
jgi:hypothetical protein